MQKVEGSSPFIRSRSACKFMNLPGDKSAIGVYRSSYACDTHGSSSVGPRR
jgi:hypothetical protein